MLQAAFRQQSGAKPTSSARRTRRARPSISSSAVAILPRMVAQVSGVGAEGVVHRRQGRCRPQPAPSWCCQRRLQSLLLSAGAHPKAL